MRRWLAYLLVWGVGTAATVGACWLGLSSVVDAAGPRRTAPFTAAELGRLEPSPTPTPTPSPARPPAADVAVANQAPPVTSSPARSATPTPATAGEWEPVSNGRGGPAYQRTFRLQAGTITFFADVNDVHVTAISLRSGYSLVPTRYDSNSLMVSLISNDRASRVYVSWRGGPYAEVTEAVA